MHGCTDAPMHAQSARAQTHGRTDEQTYGCTCAHTCMEARTHRHRGAWTHGRTGARIRTRGR
eukprot:7191972-Alexandrium_andersonii.AAC.1